MIGSALTLGRAMAERRMTETVKVGKLDLKSDETTNKPSKSIPSPRYADKGRIKYESLAVSERDGPGQPVSTQTPFLSVPTGTALFPEGDAVQVTASLVDGALVDRWYRIAGAPQAGQTTSLRYPLTEL